MRKKHYTLMTFTLAGAMALGGTGILSQKISNARTEKIITTQKKSEDTGKQAEHVTKGEEATTKKAAQNQLKLELPADAKIEEEKGGSIKIKWDGRNITYYASDSGKEIEADMLNIEEVVGTAIKSIQEYTKENNIGENIEIGLHQNILEDRADCLSGENTEEGDRGSAPIVPAGNKKNEGIWYYAVDVEGIKKHNYTLLINSVTGQVFGYVDYNDGAIDSKNDDVVAGKDNEERRVESTQYALIAEKFIKESLNVGPVKEFYAFQTGLMETKSITRETLDAFCKTEGGDVVVVTLDLLEKKVLAFEINPLDE